MEDNANLGASAILYVVQNNRNEVINLLLKNGVVAPSNATDLQLALVVTNLLRVSKSFYNDFTPLLLREETISGLSVSMTGSYSNADGSSDFCKNADNKVSSPTSYKLLCGDSTTTASATSSNSNKTSWINQGLSILQTAYSGYLQLDDNKTKRALADASIKVSTNEVKKEEATPTKTGLSTGAIVGISLLGVTVVGLVVYLIAKKQ